MTKLCLMLACATLPAFTQQQLTPTAEGPFHTDSRGVFDSHNRPFPIRGTTLPPFHPRTVAHDTRNAPDFGPHSATSLAAIRLRFNMNTVRLPFDPADSTGSDFFPELAKLVRRAHDTDLLVILSAPGGAAFWQRCAAFFRDDPNVFFDLSSAAAPQALVAAVRSTGARQPLLVSSPVDDATAIYQAATRVTATHAGDVRGPLLADIADLDLDGGADCAALPHDPAAATALVLSTLRYYDAHAAGWLVSTFEPGRLIKDLGDHNATSLEDGWTCGEKRYPAPGLGRVVQAHLRASEERGLFVVGAAGGIDVPRGGFAIAYGPVMGTRDARAASTARLPVHLAGIAVHVTDSKGVTRPAGILWATAGWGQVNFVIPDDAATGPARMTIVRDDGSRAYANITVSDTAPGLWTGVSCRGPASGYELSTGKPISVCAGGTCQTLPVAVSAAGTRVVVRGSGFRHAASADAIRVTLAGIRLRVLSYRGTNEAGIDEVVLEIPASLRGVGEADLVCHIRGRVSNPVRLHVG